MSRLVLRGGVVALAVASGLVVARRVPRSAHFRTPSGAVEVAVPHLRGAIVLDGDTDDSGWLGPTLRTGPFTSADGTPARPHSEARLAWGDGFLYLNLYAADEDIHATGSPDSIPSSDDSFRIEFEDGRATRVIEVNALGVVSDGIRPRGGVVNDISWSSRVHVSSELDGTPNRSVDHDEEWVIEMAIPFDSLGLEGSPGERIGLSMRRCDVPLGGARVCGGWGDAEPRKVLVLR